MTGAPLISCIVACHQSERYLDDALRSIRAQTWPNVEILVCDDESDATSDRAQRELAARHRARYVRHARSGPAATRNLGVREAGGDLLAFLDADDLWEREKLSRQMACLEAQPSLLACTTQIACFTTTSGTPRLADATALPGLLTTTLLARRAAFEIVGPLDPALWFSDSADWFLRANELEVALGQVADVLTWHRVHPASLSQRRSDEAAQEFLRTIKTMLDRRRAAQRGHG